MFQSLKPESSKISPKKKHIPSPVPARISNSRHRKMKRYALTHERARNIVAIATDMPNAKVKAGTENEVIVWGNTIDIFLPTILHGLGKR